MAAQRSIVDKFANFLKNKPYLQTTASAAQSSGQKAVLSSPGTTARKIIALHKVRDTDTLSGIALKYYGSAVRDYWMVIYEFNKAVIGNNPGVLQTGIELRIPELPGTLPLKRKG